MREEQHVKKFTDIDSSFFRAYTEIVVPEGGMQTYMGMHPFNFYCTLADTKLEVRIPAGYTFQNKRIPFGLQILVGVQSLYPQVAAVLEHLYTEERVWVNGHEIRCNDKQRNTLIEKMMFTLFDRKQAKTIAMRLIDFNTSVKNNNASVSYGNATLSSIKELLTKDKHCQPA